MNVEMLIIDPQNDFCDPSGSLFVGGADKDIENLTAFVEKYDPKLKKIHVTLDTHHQLDIAHPGFWVDSDGKSPNPFTLISVEDVEQGKWRPRDPSHTMRKYALEYVKALKDNDRYMLCIWPPHCLIGTPGHNVHPMLMDALLKWEASRINGFVDFVTKGSNFKTEHYSAVRADVVDPSDPTTDINTELITTLQNADMILIAGEASSHCVANTVKDIIDEFGLDNAKKITLLTDCMSAVGSFENLEKDFYDEIEKKGVAMMKSTEVFAGGN